MQRWWGDTEVVEAVEPEASPTWHPGSGGVINRSINQSHGSVTQPRCTSSDGSHSSNPTSHRTADKSMSNRMAHG